MTPFRKKVVGQGEHVGDIVRTLREEHHMSLHDLAVQSQVQEQYIRAFESFEYQKLPGDVYAKNFLRSMARVFGISEHRLLDRYQKDAASFPFSQPLSPQQKNLKEGFWNPAKIRFSVIILLLMLGLSYIGFELRGYALPPKLIITQPQDSMEVNQLQVRVSGLTNRGVTITINNAPVDVKDDGAFSAEIDLTSGVNSLSIVAKHKFGRETRVVRNIFARP